MGAAFLLTGCAGTVATGYVGDPYGYAYDPYYYDPGLYYGGVYVGGVYPYYYHPHDYFRYHHRMDEHVWRGGHAYGGRSPAHVGGWSGGGHGHGGGHGGGHR